MEIFCQVLDVEEVVLNVSPGDEGTLTRRNQGFKLWLQPQSQNLGNKLSIGAAALLVQPCRVALWCLNK